MDYNGKRWLGIGSLRTLFDFQILIDWIYIIHSYLSMGSPARSQATIPPSRFHTLV
jgi:hypothetical protein